MRRRTWVGASASAASRVAWRVTRNDPRRGSLWLALLAMMRSPARQRRDRQMRLQTEMAHAGRPPSIALWQAWDADTHGPNAGETARSPAAPRRLFGGRNRRKLVTAAMRPIATHWRFSGIMREIQGPNCGRYRSATTSARPVGRAFALAEHFRYKRPLNREM